MLPLEEESDDSEAEIWDKIMSLLSRDNIVLLLSRENFYWDENEEHNLERRKHRVAVAARTGTDAGDKFNNGERHQRYLGSSSNTREEQYGGECGGKRYDYISIVIILEII
jgi:hypothetical protein